MAKAPWITIIGLGEDGPDGLSPASRAALDTADVIMAPPRHLALLPETQTETIPWPVPFADGIEVLRTLKGRPVAVLASGDPFHYGAGRAIARAFPGEWRAFPAPSTFSLIASRLGWPLEDTLCLGLHAAPLARLRPYLAPKVRAIVTLRDGAAVTDLGAYLTDLGFGDSTLTVAEAVGGPHEQLTPLIANTITGDFSHPVCVAIDVNGQGPALPHTNGLPDGTFDTDGVMTKRAVRAVTLSALAPRPYEHLWDIGGGSGSIAIEWLLSHPTTQATTIEPRADRIALIRSNAAALGQARLRIIHGSAPEALDALDPPDVVFVGGGLDDTLLTRLLALPNGTRIVASAVSLETEALLTQAHAQHGGDLMRISIDNVAAMGPKRGWKAAYPVVQWSVTL